LLRDSGLRVYRAVGDAEAAMANKRLAVLLKSFCPSAIVVKRERWDRAQTNSHIKSLAGVMIRVAAAHSVPIFLIDQENVRKTFSNMGCETRDDIAAALARIFPELVWRLPPKRRAWQSEHPRMAMFDAIALGLAYWQHQSIKLPVPPE
jgi:Holliday junction resolvasome RuvABC endonuclease subunit